MWLYSRVKQIKACKYLLIALLCTVLKALVEVTPKGWGHMHLIVLSSKYCLEAITDAYASQSSVQQIKKQ